MTIQNLWGRGGSGYSTFPGNIDFRILHVQNWGMGKGSKFPPVPPPLLKMEQLLF